jgi:Zn-dependent M28 family amino/carboxypeptidase
MSYRRLLFSLFQFFIFSFFMLSCTHGKKSAAVQEETAVDIEFSGDSAYAYCERQCQFGPRIMNSEAHEQCGKWIAAKFRSMGLQVTEQQALLRGYDGTMLRSTNIIAIYRPEAAERIMLCAHWDSRPWADNDPDPDNWRTPVLAANDGASGVAVMLEIARLITLRTPSSSTHTSEPQIGIDFICFDAEDWGTPQWTTQPDGADTWALGAQYWAAHPHVDGYRARYGILLDMVGGSGSRFYRELHSKRYAQAVVSRVWQAAKTVGYSSYFPSQDGGMITDDHVPVNEVAGIPCIDIIPYYPDCEASSFGPTWHTVNDDMQHIDPATLKAVGQTLVQVIFTE